MPHADNLSRPPVVLIVNDQEWAARSLDSLLGPKGYAVVRATSARQALEFVRTTLIDAIIVDLQSTEISGLAFCQELKSEPSVAAAIPIIVTSNSPGGRADRIAAFSAGAWDFCTQPLDGEILLLRLSNFLRSKRELDRVRDESLIDDATGLYNLRGLARRAREIGAEASRLRQPLACIAFSVGGDPPASPRTQDRHTERLVEQIGELCRRNGRVSDAYGRVGATEFGVIAGSTDAVGAERLAERLRDAVQADARDSGAAVRFSMHVEAVADYATSTVDSVEMLMRAANDVRSARHSMDGDLPAVARP